MTSGESEKWAIGPTWRIGPWVGSSTVTTSPLCTICGCSVPSSLVAATSNATSGLASSRGSQCFRSSCRNASQSMSSHSCASSAEANLGRSANLGSSNTWAMPATLVNAWPWWGSIVEVWMKRPSLVATKTP